MVAVLDAATHEAQCIDVETGVELVEYGDLGPQHRELKGLDPLLFTTGKIDVERTSEEHVVETEPGSLCSDALGGGARRDTRGGEGLDEDFADVDAGHLDRILQAEEQSRPVLAATVRARRDRHRRG